MRKLLALLVLALVWVGLPTAVASASPLPGLECGQTITTSVRLRHDLTCSQGFLVQMTLPDGRPLTPPTPITVDLGGHSLGLVSASSSVVGCSHWWFEGPGLRCSISAGAGVALTIRNGTVVGSVGTLDSGVRIEHVHVEGGVVFTESGSGEVSDSRIEGPISDFAASAIIRRDVIAGGITTDDAFVNMHLDINHNLIAGSPANGVLINEGVGFPDMSGEIVDNVIYRSAEAGIRSAGDDLDGLQVEHNLLVDNAGDGIRLGPVASLGFPEGAPSVTLTANVALFNGGHGFNLATVPPPPSPITDGGHNIAIGNSVSPQCIGVTCTP